MANPNPRTDRIAEYQQKPHWLHLPTKPIRVPEVFAPSVEAYARLLDRGESVPFAQTQHQSPSVKSLAKMGQTWLGLRSSISQLGWAVISARESETPKVFDGGVILTDSKQPLPQRLAEIAEDLSALLDEFCPARVALETPIIDASFPSARKLWQCLGVVEMVIYRHTRLVPVKLYRATWKGNLGDVKASKDEVIECVAALFERDIRLLPEAAAIAIAYAGYCGLGS